MPGPPTTTPLRTCLDIHSHSLVAMPGSDTMWHAWATNYHSPVVLPTTTSLCLCLGHHHSPVAMPGPPITTALSLCLGRALQQTCAHPSATHYRSPVAMPGPCTALWVYPLPPHCRLGHPPPQPYSLPGLISTAVSLCLGHALPQPCSNASAHSPTTQPWLCLRHYHSSVAASPTATALWLCLVYRLPQAYGYAPCSHYHSLVPMPGHI